MAHALTVLQLLPALESGADLSLISSESLGSQRFGTRYRYRDPDSGRLHGQVLPVDLAANAESLGATVIRADGIDEFREAITRAKALRGGPVVVHVEAEPTVYAAVHESWWDVAVSQVGITLSSLVLGAFGQATIAVALAPRLASAAGFDSSASSASSPSRSAPSPRRAASATTGLASSIP